MMRGCQPPDGCRWTGLVLPSASSRSAPSSDPPDGPGSRSRRCWLSQADRVGAVWRKSHRREVCNRFDARINAVRPAPGNRLAGSHHADAWDHSDAQVIRPGSYLHNRLVIEAFGLCFPWLTRNAPGFDLPQFPDSPVAGIPEESYNRAGIRSTSCRIPPP